MGAQNAHNWTASIVIGIEPKSAHNGGYVRVCDGWSAFTDRDLARSRPAAFRDEGARQAMIRSAMMTILYPEAEVFSAPVRHDEPRFVRRDDGLGTVTQPELAQHATDVGLHGLFRDHEAVRNLDV